MGDWRLWRLVGLIAAVAGCVGQAADGFSVVHGDERQVGKADPAADAVEIIPLNEALTSASLQRTLCDEIVAKHPWSSIGAEQTFLARCPEHSFTIAEKVVSKLYVELDGYRPITLAMKVTVSDGTRRWNCVLSRVVDEDYGLAWQARIEATGSDHKTSDNDLIGQIANDIGDSYLEPDETEWGDNFVEIHWDEVPGNVMSSVNSVVAEETHDGTTAGLDERAYKLVRGGKVIGFVAPLLVGGNAPMLDGGGINLFYNVDAELIAERPWTD